MMHMGVNVSASGGAGAGATEGFEARMVRAQRLMVYQE